MQNRTEQNRTEQNRTEQNIPSLTIVSITGHQAYAQGSAYAIEQSFLALKDQIPYLQCLLISPQKPNYLANYIQHIPCVPFSYLEYNLFMIFGLGQLIQTDFCLIVQNDGWVLDGKNFKPEFFNYDYIGAPVTALVEIKDNQYIQRFSYKDWYQHRDNIPENLFEWQNGGFSLRSKRLLNAPRELGLLLEVGSFQNFDQLPLKMSWNFEKQNNHHVEDLYFSAIKRRLFESMGMKFAPRHIAAQFSVENPTVMLMERMQINEIFGCHFSSKITLEGLNKIKIHFPVSREMLEKNLFLQHFLKCGYHLILINNPDSI